MDELEQLEQLSTEQPGEDVEDALTAEDVQRIVGDALTDYEQREVARDELLANDASSKVDMVRADLASIGDGQTMLASMLQSETPTATVVVLDQSQWEELQSCWQWAKGGVQMACTLLLCVVATGAFILGTKVFGTFKRGFS